MNKVLKVVPKILPAVLLVVALFGAALHSLVRPTGDVHAQSMIRDQSNGFWGTLINTGANATVVSATTLSAQVNGPAQPNPPGFTSPSARIHLKCVDGLSASSTTLSLFEHPTSGSDKFICNLLLGAATPGVIRAGNNQGLGLDGYMTAAGSSITVLSTAASSVTGLNLTYTLE